MAKTVIVVGITLAFVFVVVALFVISADFAGSRRARAALQEARDQLETRVRERTAELAKADEATLNSEERLAGVINSAMDAILTVDEQHRIVLFNPAAEKMFGCACRRRHGAAVGSVHSRAFSLGPRCNIIVLSATPASPSGRWENWARSPECVPMVRSSPSKPPSRGWTWRGRTLFTAILRDITERVAAEEALRRQASLIDQIHDAVLVWEWDGPIISWNREAERLYGHRHDQAVGNVAHDLLRTEAAGRVEGFRRILEQTNTWEGELQHVTRDGRKIIVESRMTRMRDKGSAYVLETNRDITERKRIQEKLVEAHRRTTAILESISDGFSTFDRECCYTHVNAAAAKMLGKSPEELLGKNIWEMWPHAADSPFGVAYRRAVAENVPVTWRRFTPSLSTPGLKSAAIPRPRGCRSSLPTPPNASARKKRSGS